VAAGARRAAVRAAIRRRIAAGTLRPGDPLREAALAAELGVSRSPVREALRELEQQGLVQSFPHRGCFVATLAAPDVEEIVMLRAWLEGLAAYLAADRMGRADFRELAAAAGAIERARSGPGGRSGRGDVRDPTALLEADAAFHTALVRFSANRRLVQIWEGIDPLVWLIRLSDAAGRGSAASALAAEHHELVAALRKGPAAAEAAVRHHIVRGLEHPPRGWPATGSTASRTASRTAPAVPGPAEAR
jgi:DNA-binding GntR family transcriptional regulator